MRDKFASYGTAVMIQLRTEGFPFTPLNSNRKKELEFGEYSET